MTSALPDDSRDADEREAERHLRDLHSRSTTAKVQVLQELTIHEAKGRD